MSAVPALVVDSRDPTPAYEQLRRQLAELIGAGVLRGDTRLPPLRQLAADLGLAVGTVARTYRELENAGLVHSRRGGGTKVSPGAVRRSAADVARAIDDAAGALVRSARLVGAEDDDIYAAVRQALRDQAREPAPQDPAGTPRRDLTASRHSARQQDDAVP